MSSDDHDTGLCGHEPRNDAADLELALVVEEMQEVCNLNDRELAHHLVPDAGVFRQVGIKDISYEELSFWVRELVFVLEELESQFQELAFDIRSIDGGGRYAVAD